MLTSMSLTTASSIDRLPHVDSSSDEEHAVQAHPRVFVYIYNINTLEAITHSKSKPRHPSRKASGKARQRNMHTYIGTNSKP